MSLVVTYICPLNLNGCHDLGIDSFGLADGMCLIGGPEFGAYGCGCVGIENGMDGCVLYGGYCGELYGGTRGRFWGASAALGVERDCSSSS